MLNTFIARDSVTIYLPRSMTRSHGLPLGDPFGGPAYGRRDDPITAAFTAVFTAGGVATLASIATVVGTIGVGATVVGAITGSKALMNIGKVLGVVGAAIGVVNIASGIISGAATGAEAAVAEGVTDAMTAGSGTAGIIEGSGVADGFAINEAGEMVASQAGESALGSATGSGLASPVPDTNIASLDPSASGIAAPVNKAPLNLAPGTTVPTPTATVAQTPGATLANAPTTPTAPGLSSAPPSVNKAGVGINNASTGWLDKMLASPYGAMSAMQGAGSAMNAVGGYLTNQEQIAYNEKLRKEQLSRTSAAGRLFTQG